MESCYHSLCRQELSSAFTFKDNTSSTRERKKTEVMSQGCLGVVYFYNIFQVIMMPPCIAPKTEVKVKEFKLESGEDNTGSWIILNVNGIFLGGNCCPSGNNQDSFHCPTDLRKFKMVSLVV